MPGQNFYRRGSKGASSFIDALETERFALEAAFQGVSETMVRVASGTYVGDGTSDRAVDTGFGSTAKLLKVEIYPESDEQSVVKTDSMEGKKTKVLGGAMEPGVAFVGGPVFTVDAVGNVNTPKATYHFVAYAKLK